MLFGQLQNLLHESTERQDIILNQTVSGNIIIGEPFLNQLLNLQAKWLQEYNQSDQSEQSKELLRTIARVWYKLCSSLDKRYDVNSDQINFDINLFQRVISGVASIIHLEKEEILHYT